MKFLLAIFACVSILSTSESSAFAAESASYWFQCQRFDNGYIIAQSASLKTYNNGEEIDFRIERLKYFLAKHKSPLLPHTEYIIDMADDNEIPWSLVAAIAGVESTFCKAIPPKSNNCWGWNNGKHSFKNYRVAIKTISEKLKLVYFDRGLTTPERIGPVYAPPTPSWGVKVRYFMGLIENGSHFLPSELQIFI